MYDVLENKRSYRILNIIDDHSRECLCCEVSRSFGGYDVAEVLDRRIDRYGKPKTIKSDNGRNLGVGTWRSGAKSGE